MRIHPLLADLLRLILPKPPVPGATIGRHALNIVLLSAALPGMLLALALIYLFTDFTAAEANKFGSGYAGDESAQPVGYLAISNAGTVPSLASPDQFTPGPESWAVSLTSPVLAVAALLLAALAAGLVFHIYRRARAQTVAGPHEALTETAAPSPAAMGVTTLEVSQRLVAIQESVRRDMADYLHGHVQSKLLALSMSLSACQKLLVRDPVHAYHLLESIQTELQRVQDEDLRQVSRELYPAIVKMGLVPAIRSLVSRFSDLLEIDLVIDADVFALDALGEARLPEKQRLGIYRIAEEALNNVLKHANAKQVEVNLVCDTPERLVLLVHDDGRGFDPLSAGNSQGLVMMSDYAEAIGGSTNINSTVGQGTTIQLVIPLETPGTSEAAITVPPGPRLSTEF